MTARAPRAAPIGIAMIRAGNTLQVSKARFSGLPSLWLISTMVSLISFIPVLVLGNFSYPWRTGLLNVRLLKPGSLPVRGGSIPEPLIVRLEFGSQGDYPTVYLNASPMSLSALPAALQEALSLRPFRIVYFEADSEITWQDAVTAIDIIRGERAEVVMLTPGTKRDAAASEKTLHRKDTTDAKESQRVQIRSC